MALRICVVRRTCATAALSGIFAITIALGPAHSIASSAAAESARAVVEAYWSSSSSSSEKAYGLLTDAYKRRLRDVLGIRNAKEFAKATNIPERIWRSQTYQEITVRRPGAAQVVVLAEWEQEGYQGVTTFIFDLVQERGSWRIENIMR